MSSRFIQGSKVQNPYSFYHWQYIDIFVYFSHHTVTIPPVCWTNAAHRHGVCMLGKSQVAGDIAMPMGQDGCLYIFPGGTRWHLFLAVAHGSLWR